MAASDDVRTTVQQVKSSAKPPHSWPCSVLRLLVNIIKDVMTVVLVLVLLPIELCIFAPFLLMPLLDRMFHPKREYLGGFDAMWINHCEETVIHASMVFKEHISSELLFNNFRDVYLKSKTSVFSSKFTQRIVRRGWFWPYWAEAEASFDSDYHFRVVDGNISKANLETKMADIQMEPLDFERPPWQIWHFENYTDEVGEACSLTVFRLHHSLADGFTGMRVLMQGASPNKPPEAVAPARADRRRGLGPFEYVHYTLKSLRKLLFMPEDRPSAVKARVRIGPKDPKVVTWSTLSSASVSDLKQIGKQLGGATVNDILLSAFAGAIRRYGELASLGNKPGIPSDVTVMNWMSKAPLKDIYADFEERPFVWGNSTAGCCYLPLPVRHRTSPLSAEDALFQIQASARDPALVLEAAISHYLIAGIGGWLPRAVGGLLWPLLANKASAVMSNVPGPQFQFDWCGAPVRSMLFLVPPAGTVSLTATIMTLNGHVNVSMNADSSLINQDELRRITSELFAEEIAALAQQATGQPLDSFHTEFTKTSPTGSDKCLV